LGDTFQEWNRGKRRWQDIATGDRVIVLRGMGAKLEVVGFRTLGEVDGATDAELLRLPGIGTKTIAQIREVIRMCKAADAHRRPPPPADSHDLPQHK